MASFITSEYTLGLIPVFHFFCQGKIIGSSQSKKALSTRGTLQEIIMDKDKNCADNDLWPDDDDDDLLCSMHMNESDQIVEHAREADKNEDDVPLSELNAYLRKNSAKLLPEEDITDGADSSGVDKTYLPSDSSDTSDSNVSVRESRQRTRLSPVKYRKRQKKSTNRRSSASTSSGGEDIERVQQTSAEHHSLLTIARTFHKKRLNLLLNSNELQVSTVASDGNCFFAAVLTSLGDNRDPQLLRNQTCQHLLDNYNNYQGFLTTEETTKFSSETDEIGKRSGTNEKTKLSLFKHEVSKLSETGNWKCQIGDCLPLAISNMFERPVRIFSSSVSTPVQLIEPNIMQSQHSCISLAYIAVRGEEHYDGVVALTKTPGTPEKSGNTPATTTSPNVTPNKKANYKSPKKMQRSRKRVKQQDKWKKTVRKEKRCRGEAYLSCRGKTVEGRILQDVNCDKCRFHCTNNITSENRQMIFRNYYKLSSYELQRSFICQMVDSVPPVRSNGKRAISRQFHLVSEEKRIRVCRNFFLATLDIGRKVIEHALKMKVHGVFTGVDQRGVAASGNKTDLQTLDGVRQHIDSFPRMESHYARKDNVKTYLPQDLNIKKMYILYKQNCQKTGLKCVSESKYRNVFCTEYNISFFKPKKDQCSMCSLYEAKKRSGPVEAELTRKYEEHQEAKMTARREKETDKTSSKANKHHYVATFDLQAVLNTPCSLVGELYYARKLSVYNLSFYSLGNQQGTCHLWDETNGKRGANEIATCLFKNTKSVCNLNKTVKEITYFSDSCGGQNRNQFVAGSLLYSIRQIPTLEQLSQKFLTSGHSQMECDSIHSAIETAKKRTPVFVPSQWSTVISLAKGGTRYITIPLKFGDVLDFKEFVSHSFPNMKIAVGGERVNWLKIKWIQVRREAMDSLFVNYSFQKDKFFEIKVLSGTRKKAFTVVKHPSLAYREKLPISVAKKQDLLTLCRKEIIPTEFHQYFESLPTSAKSVDRLPGPASDEEWE